MIGAIGATPALAELQAALSGAILSAALSVATLSVSGLHAALAGAAP